MEIQTEPNNNQNNQKNNVAFSNNNNTNEGSCCDDFEVDDDNQNDKRRPRPSPPSSGIIIMKKDQYSYSSNSTYNDPLDASRQSNTTTTTTTTTTSNTSMMSIWDKPMISLNNDSSSSARADSLLVDVTKSPMLAKFPHTFVPLRHKATSIAEVTFLIPSSNSGKRQASLTAAVFNMTATIIGGGVLSIPLSCSRAGLVPFTMLMIISAIMTDFSLYILCSCTRRTGSTSFGRVAMMAVGPTLELFATTVIFFLVGFIVVGLMILNQGIWTPIFITMINNIIGLRQTEPEESTTTTTTTTGLQDALTLLMLLIIMMKFLLAKEIQSLRHICYVGFFSIIVLCIAMSYRAIEKNFFYIQSSNNNEQQQQQQPPPFHNIKWAANNIADILNALPIILLAFLCSFNIISVHCSLVKPTRERVKEVIHWSVSLSFVVMYVFGLAGYFWSYDDTLGNILLNFDPTDKVIFIGRIGCGITTLFALPMNLLPCREALLSLVAQISEMSFSAKRRRRRRRKSKALMREEQKSLLQTGTRKGDDDAGDHGKEDDDDDDNDIEEAGLMSLQNNNAAIIASYRALSERIVVNNNNNNKLYNGNINNKAFHKLLMSAGTTTAQSASTPPTTATKQVVESSVASSTPPSSPPPHVSRKEDIIHWVSTLSIVSVCYVFAVLAPGVAIVWDIAGSSMAFMIQFIIPSICYIRLKNKVVGYTKLSKLITSWNNLTAAWVLLIVATIGAILCTSVVISRLVTG